MTTTTSVRTDVDIPTETVVALLRKTDRTLECELRGSSMGSTLPDGSRLRIRFEDVHGIAVGDVIAFGAAGRVTVHRVVGRGRFGPARAFLLTRGDGSILVDHPVHERAVIGVVREWKTEGMWQPVPPPVVAGWRRAIGQLILWPVLLALHVEHRLAMALTIGGFSLRWACRKLARAPAPP